MLSWLLIAAITAIALAVPTTGYAQKAEYGTAAEARAMLEKTIAAIKADKAKALAMINKGEGGFRDRDLYPACSGLDGKVTAHVDNTRIGMDRNTMKDSAGKAYGAELMKGCGRGKNRRGVVYVSEARCRQDSGTESGLRDESGRPGLPRRLLQEVASVRSSVGRLEGCALAKRDPRRASCDVPMLL